MSDPLAQCLIKYRWVELHLEIPEAMELGRSSRVSHAIRQEQERRSASWSKQNNRLRNKLHRHKKHGMLRTSTVEPLHNSGIPLAPHMN